MSYDLTSGVERARQNENRRAVLRESLQRQACHPRGYINEVSKAAMIGDPALLAEDLDAVAGIVLQMAATLHHAGYVVPTIAFMFNGEAPFNVGPRG